MLAYGKVACAVQHLSRFGKLEKSVPNFLFLNVEISVVFYACLASGREVVVCMYLRGVIMCLFVFMTNNTWDWISVSCEKEWKLMKQKLGMWTVSTPLGVCPSFGWKTLSRLVLFKVPTSANSINDMVQLRVGMKITCKPAGECAGLHYEKFSNVKFCKLAIGNKIVYGMCVCYMKGIPENRQYMSVIIQ